MLLRRYHDEARVNEVQVDSVSEPAEDNSDKTANDELTVPELKELAKLAEVPNYSKLKRAELLEALK